MSSSCGCWVGSLLIARRWRTSAKTMAGSRARSARLVELCREMGLLATASTAIVGSKFKVVNNRDKIFRLS
jgi:hypothetical protein